MKTLKKIGENSVLRYLMSLLITFFYTGRIIAQEGAEGVNVDIETETTGGGDIWYNNVWVWVIGIALFIIIIVAIVSAGRKTE